MNLAEDSGLFLSLVWALDEGAGSRGCSGSLAGRDTAGLGLGVQTAPVLGTSSPVKASGVFLVKAPGRWRERSLAPPAASLQRDGERLPAEDLNSVLLLSQSDQTS